MKAVVVDTDVVSLVFTGDGRDEKHLSAPWAGQIEVADAWIAATTLLYDAPLVTNNPRD